MVKVPHQFPRQDVTHILQDQHEDQQGNFEEAKT